MTKTIMNTTHFRLRTYTLKDFWATICDLPEIKEEWEKLQSHIKDFDTKMVAWNKKVALWVEPDEDKPDEIQMSFKEWSDPVE